MKNTTATRDEKREETTDLTLGSLAGLASCCYSSLAIGPWCGVSYSCEEDLGRLPIYRNEENEVKGFLPKEHIK